MFDKIKTEERLRRVLDLRRSETSVAAASIIARSVRELWIDEKSEELKLDLRKLSIVNAKSSPYLEYFAKVKFIK